MMRCQFVNCFRSLRIHNNLLVLHLLFLQNVFSHAFCLVTSCNYDIEHIPVMPELGGARGATAPPQYLADQLTLFLPEGADSAQPLPLAPPNIFIFRHHCSNNTHSSILERK